MSSSRDYTAIAEQWEDDALSGRVVVGTLVLKALERQRRDIANPPAGYTFDEGAANKACALAEQLAFPKGKNRGKHFKLEPWQVWLLRVIFGWLDSATGLPRFHKVSIWLPKGSGKSPLAALIGLIVQARGKDIGAKVCCAATTQKQAANVFEAAQEMLRLSPKVREAAGLIVAEHAIKGIGDNRIFEPVSAEKRSADGRVDDCIIVDEIHQHPDRALYDVLVQNASKVDGSRLVVISTAGTDQSPLAIGWLTYCEARDVLLGKLDQAAHFAFISAADPEDDPWAEATWRKANLNYGVSVSAANFRTAAESARQDPGAQPHFLATRLGIWTQGGASWMDMNKWDAAATTLDEFRDVPVFLGLDYAAKRDLTAIVAIAVTIREDGRRVYRVKSHAYVPEHSPTVRDIPELREWAKAGFVTLTPGDIDDVYLREWVTEFQQQYPTPPPADHPEWNEGAEVCLDAFGLPAFTAWLDNNKRPHAVIKQDWKLWSPAMTEIQVALSQGRLFHDGSPVMRLCMSNVVGAVDRRGNTTPDRENDSKKIDVAVALINGIARASIADITPAPVTYYIPLSTKG